MTDTTPRPHPGERHRIETLTRRRDHLKRLLDQDERTDSSWLAAEAAALTWALKIIHHHLKETPHA